MGDNARFLIINSFSVHWNGVIIALAMLACVLLSLFLRSMQRRSINNLLITAIVSIVCAFIGSRIYFYWNASEYFSGFGEIFSFTNGGYAMYGALMGAVVGTAACSYFLKESLGELLDVIAPGIALGIGIGRWAALFSGENLGPAVDSLQQFPFAVYSEAESAWMSAFFFYQSLIALVICGITCYLFFAKYVRKNLKCKTGDIFLMFALLYTLPQGVFELFRIDPLYFHPIFIKKLKTVPISLAWSAIFSAAVLSIFILRRVFRNGVSLSTAWPVAACAAGYIGYFNITMRIEMPDNIANALVVIGCILLIVTGVALFVLSIKERQMPPREKNARTGRPGSYPQRRQRSY